MATHASLCMYSYYSDVSTCLAAQLMPEALHADESMLKLAVW